MLERALTYRGEDRELLDQVGRVRTKALKRALAKAGKLGDHDQADRIEGQLRDHEVSELRRRITIHPGDAGLRLELGQALHRSGTTTGPPRSSRRPSRTPGGPSRPGSPWPAASRPRASGTCRGGVPKASTAAPRTTSALGGSCIVSPRFRKRQATSTGPGPLHPDLRGRCELPGRGPEDGAAALAAAFSGLARAPHGGSIARTRSRPARPEDERVELSPAPRKPALTTTSKARASKSTRLEQRTTCRTRSKPRSA